MASPAGNSETSSGGPLVLLQASSASTWRGVIGADYDDACAVTGYAGVLRKERRDILVLGDEPMSTAHLTVAGEHVLVRWICGPDKQAVLDAVARMRGALGKVIEEVNLDIVEDGQFIIDSGAPAQAPPRPARPLRAAPG